MKFLKHFALLGFLAIILVSMHVSASAQKQTTVSSTNVRTTTGRRIVLRRYRYYDPFRHSFFYSDYDPYFYDPFLRAQREKYYLQQDVKDKRNDLAKHREKYNADGFLTIEEREKLARDEDKLAKAVAKLNKFNEEY